MPRPRQERQNTAYANPMPPCYSSLGLRIQASIAALKAAKPAQPSAAPDGPPDRPRMAPVTHPAATPLVMSFLARSPSIPHSMPENSAPTVAKPLALLHDRRPISRKPCASCCRSGSDVMSVTAAPALEEASAAAPDVEAVASGEGVMVAARGTAEVAVVAFAALAIADDGCVAGAAVLAGGADALPAIPAAVWVCVGDAVWKGVSYAIYVALYCQTLLRRGPRGEIPTDAMNMPNNPPSPKPMPPAMIDFA
jgi:hypothetical protein